MTDDVEDDGGDEGGQNDAQQLPLDHNKCLNVLKVDLFHANPEINNFKFCMLFTYLDQSNCFCL